MRRRLFLQTYFATSIAYLSGCGGDATSAPAPEPQAQATPAPAPDPKPDLPSPAEQTVIVDSRGHRGGRHE